MNRQQQFLEAAERAEGYGMPFCCQILKDVGGVGLKESFADVFAPFESETFLQGDIDWRGYKVGAWGKHWGDDNKECRVLALCFAAAMAETGDL